MEGETRLLLRESFTVDEIERNLQSRRSLALYRIRLLEDGTGGDDDNDDDDDAGFAAWFWPLLRRSIDDVLAILSNGNTKNDPKASSLLLSERPETTALLRALGIYRTIGKLDAVLAEEIARQGGHSGVSRIIRIDIGSIDACRGSSDDIHEANQDTVIEVQDLAGEIAASSKTFPLATSPLVREDLVSRLPRVFRIRPERRFRTGEGEEPYRDGMTVLVHQVTERQSAQKDVGFVLWPSAVVLSRWLVSNPQVLRGKTVLELGAGCGLTGLVAARIQQDDVSSTRGRVVLSDFNETVVRNLQGNIDLNGLAGVAWAEALDFYEQTPDQDGRLATDGLRHPAVDLVLAADVICQPSDAFAMARTVASALREGGHALVVSADAQHRFGVEQIGEACAATGCLDVVSVASVGGNAAGIPANDDDDDDDDDDMEKTAGFVRGMALTMYTIRKKARTIPS